MRGQPTRKYAYSHVEAWLVPREMSEEVRVTEQPSTGKADTVTAAPQGSNKMKREKVVSSSPRATPSPVAGDHSGRQSAVPRQPSAAPSTPTPPATGQSKRLGSGGRKEGGGVGSQASGQLANSNKLEDQINLQHLVELMKTFHEADENGSDGLDIEEFRAAFGQILGKGKDDQKMDIMFMKIDTNCDGTVDWDEFCTYMLLEYQEKDLMVGEKLPLFPYPLKVLPNNHRDVISKIAPLPSLARHSNRGGVATGQQERSDGRFVSVCKDGTVCFWKSNYTLQRMVHVESGRSRLTWVTDMVVMVNVNKIIISFTDSMLVVYDIVTFDPQLQMVGFPHCVLTMDYWYDPKDLDHAVLVFGDSGGGVGVIEFLTATSHLFPAHGNRSQEVPHVTFPELLYHKTKSNSASYMPRIHDDWVCKVEYCPYMEYCMSCSNDSACSLHLADRHGRKEGSVMRVRKGITSFDYCKEWNIIATGGLDRILRLWNPYVPAKPTAVMKGHTAAIMHVAIHSAYGEVLSFSRDLELRVWELKDQLCLQVCHRFQQLLPQPPSAFCLHPHNGALLIGTNHLGVLEPCRDDELKINGGQQRDVTLSHEKPLTAALYNLNFNQVVSGCQGGVVSVWDVETGEKTMQFSRCHGDVELTAMTFDPSGRRLITGGRDGSLKIWNFNNGACLSVLENRYRAEITSICFLKQRIIVGGWSRVIAAYSDTRDPDDAIPKYFGSKEHNEDILCLTGQDPSLLATASYDGDVLLWNIDTERCVGRLNAGKEEMRMPRPVFGCTGKRHLKSTLPRSERCGCDDVSSTGEEKKVFRRDKDERAVEKLVFLKRREPSLTGASLIACGAGGWVQFWNTSGGGLVGEFNIWDNRRHTLRESVRHLESVTALRVNEMETVMYTGSSMGYIQLWDITDYCPNDPVSSSQETTPTIIEAPPPLLLVWRAHLSSIVTIDLAEHSNLIITASTDHCVRLWTNRGRYIGTFGERVPWQLPPPRSSAVQTAIPPDLHRASSFETIQTISGVSKSKWTLARNLFRCIMVSPKPDSDPASEGRETGRISSKDILGRHYKRRTRVRQPIESWPLQQIEGLTYAIYTTLTCPEVEELKPVTLPFLLFPPSTPVKEEEKMRSAAGVSTPRTEHTEASLLQGVWRGQRRTTLLPPPPTVADL